MRALKGKGESINRQNGRCSKILANSGLPFALKCSIHFGENWMMLYGLDARFVFFVSIGSLPNLQRKISRLWESYFARYVDSTASRSERVKWKGKWHFCGVRKEYDARTQHGAWVDGLHCQEIPVTALCADTTKVAEPLQPNGICNMMVCPFGRRGKIIWILVCCSCLLGFMDMADGYTADAELTK